MKQMKCYWMKLEMEAYQDKVTFTTYNSEEALKIHADKHIAVIPTVGSEGTSLSLLEAMSAQCAVICTDVGGMTNVVIDRYNGLMINAGDSQMLYKAIKELINDEKLLRCLAERGYETFKNGFSYTMWSNRWKDVVCKLMEA